MTFSGGSGSAAGRYRRRGKTVDVSLTVHCVASGNIVTVGLPVQAGPAPATLAGRETSRTGAIWVGTIGASGTSISPVTLGNAEAMSAGDNVTLSGVYESV